MKKLMMIFLLGVLLTACQKEDFVPQNDIAEQGQETNTENDDTGNNDNDMYDEEGETVQGSLSNYKVNGNTISLIEDYPVSEELKPFQDNKARHQKIWEHVTRLLPIESRNNIVEFEVFHGGDELAGFVVQVDDSDLSKWKFAMAIDLDGNIDELNFQNDFTYVALHEVGHILTLNETQVELRDEEDCSNYFTGEGCSKTNSYINRLFDLGWADIIGQHNPDFPKETYEKYQDRFHSDYAATNPGEDIAEVFTHFMMEEDIPAGRNIAEQKVKLLFEYPELVSLRDEIRERVRPVSARFPASSLKGKIKVFGSKKHK